MADIEFVTFENVARGLFASVNATGAMTMLRLWRCKMAQSERLAVVRHDPASDQRIMLMLVGSSFETTEDTVDATGSALVETADKGEPATALFHCCLFTTLSWPSLWNLMVVWTL